MPIAKSGQIIASLADWERHAPPTSPNHWKDDRSAKEVARTWLEGKGISLPPEVAAALAAHPRFGQVVSWEAEPEANLRFDKFPGKPRNSDLLVVAADSFGQYVLAVEAKADETYSETVADAFAAALEERLKNPRSNRIARIELLVSRLLREGTSNQVKAAELRYQLLTACAGAVAEAVRRGVSRAVMLVHEFITPDTTDANHERNEMDLRRFLSRMGVTTIEAIVNGQLYGPFAAVGAEHVELYVGKVVRNIRNRSA